MATTLKFYLAKLFLRRWGFLAVCFMALILLLDVIANGDQLASDPDATIANIFTYMYLRAPILFVKIFPFTAVLATLITLMSLTHQHELVAMLGAGMSQADMLTALVPVGLLVAGFHFLVDDQLATRATSALNTWGIGDYAAGDNEDAPNGTWIRFQDRTLKIGLIVRPSELHDIKVFRRDDDGLVADMVQAKRAIYRDGRWHLEEESRSVVPEAVGGVRRDVVLDGLDPALTQTMQADPEELSFIALAALLASDVVSSRPQYLYALELHRRLAQPMFAIAVFLLLIPLFQRFDRSARGIAILFGGMVLAFVFFTFDNLMIALGEAALLPAFVAAWAAIALFVIIGAYMAIRRENL